MAIYSTPRYCRESLDRREGPTLKATHDNSKQTHAVRAAGTRTGLAAGVLRGNLVAGRGFPRGQSSVDARIAVLFTLTRHPDSAESHYVAHLLNYAKTPRRNVRLRCPGAANVKILALTSGCDTIVPGKQPGEWIIPSLGLYSMVLVE